MQILHDLQAKMVVPATPLSDYPLSPHPSSKITIMKAHIRMRQFAKLKPNKPPLYPVLCSSKSSNSSLISQPKLKSIKSHFCSAFCAPKYSSDLLFFQSTDSFNAFSSLVAIKPYVQSEWVTILKGWLCSAISVYCLSISVHKFGSLSGIVSSLDWNRVIREMLPLAVIMGLQSAASYLQQAFLWEAALSSIFKIRVYVFGKVLERDLQFFEGGDAVSVGDIAHRIAAEASDVADTIFSLLSTVVPEILQLSVIAIQMLVNDAVLALISVSAIPLISLVIAYLGERLQKLSRKAHLSIAALSAYMGEVLPSVLIIKANDAEACEVARFQKLASHDLNEHLNKKKMKVFIPQIMQVLYTAGLLIFCISCLVISRGSIDGLSRVSFLTSMLLLIKPFQNIGKTYNELQQGKPAIQRLLELANFSCQVVEDKDAVDLNSVRGDIKFCGVSFKYGDNRPLILNEVDFHIKAGETVALVGASGGGKTTLMKLLLRFYQPLHGCILVDDHDIWNIRLGNLRSHISLVSQDMALFSGTVAENIGYKDLMGRINMNQVEQAAKIANADEFIVDLPQGYSTFIGPRGSLFSGGQKQRIAIARALYRRSSILILDEATSALDNRSELLVRQAIERLLHDHTVLVIAHNVETVAMADRILLLDSGKIREIPQSAFFKKHGCEPFCKIDYKE